MSRQQVEPPPAGPSSPAPSKAQETTPGRVVVENLTPYDLDVQAIWTTDAARIVVRVVVRR